MQREKLHIFFKKARLWAICLFIFAFAPVFPKTQPVFPEAQSVSSKEPVSSEVQPTFYITAEEIIKAIPTPPDVNFSKKQNREIATMERRHFSNVNEYDSDKYRIAKLEERLLGRTWEFLPVDDRMRKLKLASQRKMLSGTSIPLSLRRAGFSQKRIANDSTPVYDDNENVGLIDGFLKLINPDAYNSYSAHKKRMYEQYGYE